MCVVSMYEKNNIFLLENMSNSMQTYVWGPCLWTYLHVWSMSFPIKPTQSEKLLFAKTLFGIICTMPCNICVENVSINLEKVGFAKPHTAMRLSKSKFVQSRETFTKFIFDFHNCVSTMLGKDVSHIRYKDVMDDLEVARAKHCGKKRKIDTSINDGHGGVEDGCTQPAYKACRTKIYIVARQLEGGEASSQENRANLNVDINL